MNKKTKIYKFTILKKIIMILNYQPPLLFSQDKKEFQLKKHKPKPNGKNLPRKRVSIRKKDPVWLKVKSPGNTILDGVLTQSNTLKKKPIVGPKFMQVNQRQLARSCVGAGWGTSHVTRSHVSSRPRNVINTVGVLSLNELMGQGRRRSSPG